MITKEEAVARITKLLTLIIEKNPEVLGPLQTAFEEQAKTESEPYGLASVITAALVLCGPKIPDDVVSRNPSSEFISTLKVAVQDIFPDTAIAFFEWAQEEGITLNNEGRLIDFLKSGLLKFVRRLELQNKISAELRKEKISVP